MPDEVYIFVLTPIELLCPTGVELAPGYRLVRANSEQVKCIKEKLERFNSSPFFSTLRYETCFHKVPGEARLTSKSGALENRYWIIAYDGTGAEVELNELGWACSLIPNDIELGFYFSGSCFGWEPAALSSYFNNSPDYESMVSKNISMADVAQIRQNFDGIKNLPVEFPHIRRALQRFGQIYWLPRRSEMVVIGLISVIESLVSHAPKLTDSADSLSHQLRTKLPLLRKRFTYPHEYIAQFGEIEEDNLWKKLYAYRSKIVHGEDSQLSGDLTCLKNIETVIGFLRETSKRLLHLSLREPQFMTDLKKC